LGLTLDEPQKDEAPIKIDDMNILISEDIRDFASGRQIEYYSYQNQGWFKVERPGSARC
jgi:hypothetical protein